MRRAAGLLTERQSRSIPVVPGKPASLPGTSRPVSKNASPKLMQMISLRNGRQMKQIAFVSDRTGHNEIYVMDAAGGDVRKVTNDKSDDIHPHWSPDGQRNHLLLSAR